MVGRATSITGPYADKAGKDMMQGAAEQLLASSGRYIGPGGGTAWKDGDTYLYVYHYYDGDGGRRLEAPGAPHRVRCGRLGHARRPALPVGASRGARDY